MQKIHLEKQINAPRQTVWDKIVSGEDYSVWTEAFGTSKMLGDWIEGKLSITQTFDAEQENSFELQRSGWESILENFKKYVESN